MPVSVSITWITGKVRLEEPENRAEGAAVGDRKTAVLLTLLCFILPLAAQQLPDEELQANFSGYFDNFQVTVIYPNFALTRHVTESTAITGRYLVDLVSAASIRAGNGSSASSAINNTAANGEFQNDHDDKISQKVDVVTAASGRSSGGGGGGVAGTPGTPIKLADDVRNEFVLGVTQLIPRGTFSVNGLSSREHDYSSRTIAGTISQSFAQKNSTFEIGFVRSWDRVFPVTKTWTRDVNVETADATFSQIFSTRLLTQLIFSYTNTNGQLADVYRTIKIASSDSIVQFDPVHPYSRQRRALADKIVYRLDPLSSITMGYRYYWDSWDIRSHTISGLYQRHVSRHATIGIGGRTYFQNAAFFFKEKYTAPQQYMTADSKLDKMRSTELELKLTVNGGDGQDFLPYLDNEKVQYDFSLNWYRRHTNSPDWFTGKRNLSAIYFNAGIRYKF